MDVLSLLVAAAAFVLAFVAFGRANALRRKLTEVDTEARRRATNLSAEIEQSVNQLRQLLAAVASDEPISAEQILEGRLWRDIGGAEGRAMVAAGEARLLDVRSRQETSGGIIPGAQLVPVDELEARLSEVPKDGKATIVYCAMGSRSAYACELLSHAGHQKLYNLEGGISAWGGAIERPAAAS